MRSFATHSPPSRFAPARDRAAAQFIARQAGFLLLSPLRCDEFLHSWLVRCASSFTDAELVIYRHTAAVFRGVNRKRAHEAGVLLGEWARQLDTGLFTGQFDRLDSDVHGLLQLHEYHVRSRVESWLGLEPFRRHLPGQLSVGPSSAGSALLIDLLRGGARLREAGLCLGRPVLPDMAVTVDGCLQLVSDRSLHQIEYLRGQSSTPSAVFDRQCCRLGVHPQSVMDLANTVLNPGNRRELLLSEVERLASDPVHPHRSEAIELAIADAVVPRRARSPSARELRAHQRDLAAGLPAASSQGGWPDIVTHLGLVVGAVKRSRVAHTVATRLQLAGGNRTIVRKVSLMVGLGLLLVALVSLLLPAPVAG